MLESGSDLDRPLEVFDNEPEYSIFRNEESFVRVVILP